MLSLRTGLTIKRTFVTTRVSADKNIVGARLAILQFSARSVTVPGLQFCNSSPEEVCPVPGLQFCNSRREVCRCQACNSAILREKCAGARLAILQFSREGVGARLAILQFTPEKCVGARLAILQFSREGAGARLAILQFFSRGSVSGARLAILQFSATGLQFCNSSPEKVSVPGLQFCNSPREGVDARLAILQFLEP